MALTQIEREERFWAKVDKSKDCWEWTGYKNRGGYGVTYLFDKKMRTAHRMSFELANGPIGEGLVISHSCDNPRCINPSHLSAATQKQNIRDMVARGRFCNGNMLKTHCPAGHEFTPDNLYNTKDGARVCKQCNLAKLKQRRSINGVRVYVK